MERRQRVLIYAVVVLLAGALLAGQAVTAPSPATTLPGPGETARPYPGNTLITVQAIGWFGNNNGKAIIVNPQGEVIWEYDPPNTRVFDGEQLDNGNLMFSTAVAVTGPRCPDRYGDSCVHNRVVELDRETKDVVWVYGWWDVYPSHHEVHDADRLPTGETAIIDMGNNRAFTVNQQGEITWQWNASEHLVPGTEFWRKHVPPDERDDLRREGPESDWTHMNDIDRLPNGNFQLSIRNYDVIIEVNPETNRIVGVVGTPGDHSVMYEQHNPHRLTRHGTILVADSENNRVVEIDIETEEVVWAYDGTGSGQLLRWPRDADRLPNGNTLIADSRNFRVLEVGPNGTVVWSYSLHEIQGIVYDADRLSVPEEPQNVPSGRVLQSRTSKSGVVIDTLVTVESWMGFVFPYWLGVPELLTAIVGLGAVGGLAVEGIRIYRE